MSGRRGLRRQATSARNRRALLAGDVEASAGLTFRRRLQYLLRWLMAEADAATPEEQELLLNDLHERVDQMNRKRQAMGRVQ